MSDVDGTHAFAIVDAEVTILEGARWGDALPKVGVWCRRDAIFTKEIAFGVDETTLDLTNVHLV